MNPKSDPYYKIHSPRYEQEQLISSYMLSCTDTTTKAEREVEILEDWIRIVDESLRFELLGVGEKL
jgi:hypothetical protein